MRMYDDDDDDDGMSIEDILDMMFPNGPTDPGGEY